MSVMMRHLSLVLAMLVAFTGQQIAVARGAAALSEGMVLCLGGTTVMVPLDADGQPTGAGHVCPDAALSIALLPAAPLPAAPIRTAIHVTAPTLARAEPVSTHRPAPPARGPPDVLI